VRIRVKAGFSSKKVPSLVRSALENVTVWTIFTKEQLKGNGFSELPDNARIAYIADIHEALVESQQQEAAVAARNLGDDCEFVVFAPGEYELVG
jgi:hypothetical protein